MAADNNHPQAEDLEDDDLARFAPVLACLRLECVPSFALSVRERQTAREETALSNIVATPSLSCEVLDTPLHGSFNIVHVLKFSDGTRWALKVPITGHHDEFDEDSARELTTEALIMRLIARETTIPIPKVHYFDSSFENELQCPFILMDLIDGVSCHDSWFDSSIDKTLLEQRRARTLQTLAEAIIQLNKFSFSLSGTPIFDNDGNINGIGPMRVQDINAALARLDVDDDNESPIFCEIGPYTNAKAFMLSMLDRREPPPSPFGRGIYNILRLFIQWVPDDTREPRFVLTHPDLDSQNVLVTKDGSLAGIIDWDGAAVVPRMFGNESFPSWLTRDWDPAMYAYGRKPPDGQPPYRENSPEELARYRSMYLRCLRSVVPKGERVQLTGISLLTQNLNIAADHPVCTDGIVQTIFKESLKGRRSLNPHSSPSKEVENGDTTNERKNDEAGVHVADADQVDAGAADEERADEREETEIDEDLVYLYNLSTELVDGEFNPVELEKVKEGFLALCSKLNNPGVDVLKEAENIVG